MFKISPIQDKTEQNKICKLFGIESRDGAFAYLMYDNDTHDIMGMSQFEILSGEAIIYDLREVEGADDNEAMFILGRQTMNFIEMCGVQSCYAEPDAGDSTLLSSIGFKTKRNEKLFCDLTGMFDGHCGNH